MKRKVKRRSAALVAGCVFVAMLGYAAGEPRLRGIVHTRAGENIEGWIRFEKETTYVEKLAAAGVEGEVREIPAQDFKSASMHVVGASAPGLKGKYYKDTNFGGEATERIDSVIDFSWGTKPPMSGFPADNYSVRWEGEIESTTTGNYKFHASSDDGVRLWIDNRGVLDRWTNQAETEVTAGIDLQAGRRYPIRLEYFEGGSTAALHLRWTPPGGKKAVVPKEKLWHQASPATPPKAKLPNLTEAGLLGSYFRGLGFGGAVVKRRDPAIKFNWTSKEPMPGFGLSQYSVRWEGQVVGPINGDVNFHTKTDDGVRLWVGDKLLVDQWREMSATEFTGVVPMAAGKRYPIRMEYFQSSSQAEVELSWSSPRLGKRTIPTSHLFAASTGSRSAMPGEGLLLTGGSVLLGKIVEADEKMVEIEPVNRPAMKIPKRSIGAILFGHLDGTRRSELEKRRSGCVVRGKDDYFESDLVTISGGEIELNSPLFGERKFPANRLFYIKLNGFEEAPANYEVKTKSGSVLRADQLILDGGKAMVKDNSLWWIKLHPGDVATVKGIYGEG